jgi:uncharacterized membrane protein YcaP (DUF421 family)
MDAVVRGLIVYVFLLLVFRVAGKRTLAQTTTFDFVLLLIISETIQQAMLDSDNSLTHGLLLVLTLVGVSVALSFLKEYVPWAEKAIDSTPTIILDDGILLRDRMEKLRVDESDILESARERYGLERLDQIKYAILERTGTVSIVPREGAGA